jgi:hypothetical protein
MTDERLAELNLLVARGARALVIIESAGWKNDVLPYLVKRETELCVGAVWRPGNTPEVGAVALGSSYNGGRYDECKNLDNVLKIWVELAESANAELTKEHKK